MARTSTLQLRSALSRLLVSAPILVLVGCSGDSSEEATDTSVDALEDVLDAAQDTPPESTNAWFIDDEEHPALYASLNCQNLGGDLYLNGTDTGGSGTIQIRISGMPTSDADYTIVPMAAELGDGEASLSIGRDRDEANQFVAQSGTLSVTVVTGSPRSISVSFSDVPGTTTGGANAALSGDVIAQEGAFVGACDFDDLAGS